MLVSVSRGLRSRPHLQLHEDIAKVPCNGFLANDQLGCNLTVGFADHQLSQDFALTVAQWSGYWRFCTEQSQTFEFRDGSEFLQRVASSFKLKLSVSGIPEVPASKSFPLLEKPGLKRIRFHDLRHSAANLLLSEGTHPKIVSERLGHSRVSVTLDLDSHVTPTMQQQAVDAMDKLLA